MLARNSYVRVSRKIGFSWTETNFSFSHLEFPALNHLFINRSCVIQSQLHYYLKTFLLRVNTNTDGCCKTIFFTVLNAHRWEKAMSRRNDCITKIVIYLFGRLKMPIYQWQTQWLQRKALCTVRQTVSFYGHGSLICLLGGIGDCTLNG